MKYKPLIYIDLNGKRKHSDKIYCNDAKSTSSFDWASKPEELIQDTQGIIYPLYVMQKYRVDVIEPRWVYMLTEDRPAARAVDFRVTFDGARRRALPLFDEGAALISKINERADPNQLTANTGACDMYHRKCVYHHSVGGPCKAESSPGKMARAFLARGTKQERTIMAFNRGAITQAAAAPAEDANPGEGAVETTAEETPAQTETRRGRRPKSAIPWWRVRTGADTGGAERSAWTRSFSRLPLTQALVVYPNLKTRGIAIRSLATELFIQPGIHATTSGLCVSLKDRSG